MGIMTVKHCVGRVWKVFVTEGVTLYLMVGVRLSIWGDCVGDCVTHSHMWEHKTAVSLDSEDLDSSL